MYARLLHSPYNTTALRSLGIKESMWDNCHELFQCYPWVCKPHDGEEHSHTLLLRINYDTQGRTAPWLSRAPSLSYLGSLVSLPDYFPTRCTAVFKYLLYTVMMGADPEARTEHLLLFSVRVHYVYWCVVGKLRFRCRLSSHNGFCITWLSDCFMSRSKIFTDSLFPFITIMIPIHSQLFKTMVNYTTVDKYNC